MKILVISNYRSYHTARPEAEIFIGLKRIGHDITIMTHHDAGYIKRFEEHGIRVIPEHPTQKNDYLFLEIAKKELIEGKYDILHLFNNKAIRNGIKAAKDLPVKVIIYRGASANMAWYNPFNYLKFFHPRIDAVVCNSEEIRQKFMAVPLYNSDKAITILKGQNIEWYIDIPTCDIRAELDIPVDSLLYVTVANNRRVKGVDILLKAMRYLPSNIDLHLIIIGEKMQKHPIPKLRESSGKKERIHFLGFREDALSIVANCDIYICPSTGSEALTKSVIEAMCMGITPIISDIPGNKPLVDHMVNGLIFNNKDAYDLSDKMLYLFNNKSKIASMSEQAKLKIQKDINSKNTIHEYDEFYKGLV